jgi:hypothetical protein
MRHWRQHSKFVRVRPIAILIIAQEAKIVVIAAAWSRYARLAHFPEANQRETVCYFGFFAPKKPKVSSAYSQCTHRAAKGGGMKRHLAACRGSHVWIGPIRSPPIAPAFSSPRPRAAVING